MKESRDWDFFRNMQRKIAYHPKCQRCSRNCKQSWRVKTLICPGFAKPGEPLIFPFCGREPPQG